MSDRSVDTQAASFDPASRLTAAQRRQGRRLLRCWRVVAAIYVVAVGAWSLGPIRRALAEAPAASSATRTPQWASPPVKVVLRQVGVAFAPPLLVLWFGWDVWFAVVGFLGPRRGRDPEPPSASTG